MKAFCGQYAQNTIVHLVPRNRHTTIIRHLGGVPGHLLVVLHFVRDNTSRKCRQVHAEASRYTVSAPFHVILCGMRDRFTTVISCSLEEIVCPRSTSYSFCWISCWTRYDSSRSSWVSLWVSVSRHSSTLAIMIHGVSRQRKLCGSFSR